MGFGIKSASGSSGGTLAYKGRWMPNTEYAFGDVVSVDGVVSEVNTAHTSAALLGSDAAKFTPTESTQGWALTVDYIVTASAALPSSAGATYIFLVAPVGGMPAGTALGDVLYFSGDEWVRLRTYAKAPTTVQCGNVQWYKFKGTWFYDTEWDSYTPAITASTGTAPTGTGVTFYLQYRLRGGSMEMTYHRTGSASSTGGTGPYLLGMPTGVRIDTTKAVPDLTYASQASGTLARTKSLPLGHGVANWNGTGFPLTVFAYDENRYFFECAQGVSSSQVKLSSNVWYAMNDAQATIYANLNIPIKRSWEA